MVNGTTRLIQDAAPSEAVVYAQALSVLDNFLKETDPQPKPQVP